MFGALSFKRDRFALFVVLGAAISIDLWFLLFGFDYLYTFRGLIFYYIAFIFLADRNVDYRHAVITGALILWYCLLSIEDALNSNRYPLDWVYNNFEAGCHAAGLLYLFVAVDNHFEGLRSDSINNFNGKYHL